MSTPNNTGLRAVLFDMDGTLLDSEKIWDVALDDLAESLGGRLSQPARVEMVGSNLMKSVHILHDDLGVGAGAADLAASGRFLSARAAELFATTLEWRPGAQELLTAVVAAGLPTGLVTSTQRPLTEICLNTLGRQNFTVTVCGDEVEHPKPAPDSYVRAAALLGLTPGNCLAIEDSPTGTTSALAAGCTVLGVPLEVPLRPRPRMVLRDSLVGLAVDDLRALVAA